MLLSFSVENFRSFRGEQTLNMLAAKRFDKESDKSGHRFPVPATGEAALRVASLYGPNGAGKSNLVRALSRLQKLVVSGTPRGKGISHEPFLLDDESRQKPTTFDIQFLADGEVFRYGVCFGRHRVHEEWLDVHEGKKEKSVFARTTDEHGAVSVELGPGAKAAEDRPETLKGLEKAGTRPNQLFLTEVLDRQDPEAQGGRLHRATQWFNETLLIIKPSTWFTPLVEMLASEEGFSRFAGDFLREADTGIGRLEVNVSEVSKPELQNYMSRFLGAAPASDEDLGKLRLLTSQGEDFFRDEDKGTIYHRQVTATHGCRGGKEKRLPISEESDGSQRLLHLLPALYRIAETNSVFVVDELERSMHPALARKFVEFFLKAGGGSGSQLIFTTHESHLLDLDLMRRDEIWFTEKDDAGATQLYSLADFKIRKDHRIGKGYLLGRYGAIPFLGGIDRLMEQQAAEEATP